MRTCPESSTIERLKRDVEELIAAHDKLATLLENEFGYKFTNRIASGWCTYPRSPMYDTSLTYLKTEDDAE